MPVKRKYKSAPDPRKAQGALRATVRKRVFAMYDTCGICGKPVDKTLPPYTPLSPEVDEIFPVSRGGSPYDIDNLQLVHSICNKRKGAKVAGEGKPVKNPTPNSRNW